MIQTYNSPFNQQKNSYPSSFREKLSKATQATLNHCARLSHVAAAVLLGLTAIQGYIILRDNTYPSEKLFLFGFAGGAIGLTIAGQILSHLGKLLKN